MGEPHEVPGVVFNANIHLRTSKEAQEVVHSADLHARHPRALTVSEDDGATALRDWRMAEYEARLCNRQVQTPVAP